MTELGDRNLALYVPQICSLHVQSNIRYRYVHTVVHSKVINTADIGQEVTFSVTLPETSFISSFSIEVDGKTYDAKVKEKEEAKKEYVQAVKRGRTAAHVAINPRESNRFSVSVNVEAKKKIKFTLTYEELLNRKLGTYKHFINLEPGQIVDDFSVQVNIEESTDIITLTVPPFKENGDSDIASPSDATEVNTLATVSRPTPHSAIVKFAPTPDQQRKLSTNGIKGQLVVLYDVDRSSFPSQIMVNDGYFAHFFAPDQLKPLPKYVTFVLDVSGSMNGRKIEQLKEAMESILSELNPQDYFTLITFETRVNIWRMVGDDEFSIASIQETDWKSLLVPATIDNIIRAKLAIHKLRACGGTDIYNAFMTATHVTQLRLPLQQAKSIVLEPLIIFLTDGQPTAGQCRTDEIISETTRWNQMGKAAIFSLGIGTDVDFDFLKKLSLRNSGFARKIYEASDTALQLSNFYKEVSSPLLSNITFIYQPEQVELTSVTRNHFVTFFHGSELIVCGQVGQQVSENDFYFSITGNSSEGTRQFEPQEARVNFVKNMGFMERLWGYLTIQQLLEEESKLDGEQAAEKRHQATQLALKFSFVTPVTSLVVVQPEGDLKSTNEETDVDLSDYDMLHDHNLYIANSRCASISYPDHKIVTKCHKILKNIEKKRNRTLTRGEPEKFLGLSSRSDEMDKPNTYKCKKSRPIADDSSLNLRIHISKFHPKELKNSMLDFYICHPDGALVSQQVIGGMNNTNISHVLQKKIQDEAMTLKSMIESKVSESILYLLFNITMKQNHVFLMINIQSILPQNKVGKMLTIIEVPTDSTPETLAHIVNKILQEYRIDKSHILFFITDCIYGTTDSSTKEDKKRIEKTATTLIEGVQSIGICGGWNPEKILNDSVSDALKSLQPMIIKLEKSLQKMNISVVSDNTEQNIGVKDWHSAYNTLNVSLKSKETTKLGITEEEWQEIELIADVLKPIKSAMETLEKKQYTIDDLYGTWTDYTQNNKKNGTSFAETLSICIQNKATNECPLFVAIQFLDPKYKSLLDDHQVSLATEQIMKIWQFLTLSWGIGVVGNKEIPQLLRGYKHSIQETTNLSALQYWESQKEVQSTLYKIASVIYSLPLFKSSLDQIFSNIEIMLSPLADELKQSIVKIRCLEMSGMG